MFRNAMKCYLDLLFAFETLLVPLSKCMDLQLSVQRHYISGKKIFETTEDRNRLECFGCVDMQH